MRDASKTDSRATVLAVAFLAFCLRVGGLICSAQELSLAACFSDHMVLQRGQPIPIWGIAPPDKTVTVHWNGQQQRAQSSVHGDWRVTFPSLQANPRPSQLQVTCEKQTTLVDDVLVGEVWLCAGQSNMELSVKDSDTASYALQVAKNAALRLLPRRGRLRGGGTRYSDASLSDLRPDAFCTGTWQRSSKETVAPFSAVGFFFGHALRDALDVPVGVIDVSLGGTPTEAWIAKETLRATPTLRPLLQGNWLHNPLVAAWCRKRAVFNLQPELGRSLLADELGPHHSFKPGFMWQAAMAPLQPFPVRGFLWYQGESNAESAAQIALHETLFTTLVRDWRHRWQAPNAAFLYVQLPGMKRPHWPAFRDQQRKFLTRLEHLGMAITIDLGHATDVHPRAKQPVAERLARLARAQVYGDAKIVPCGPLPKTFSLDADTIEVCFDHAGAGLHSADGAPIRHFEVAGADETFAPATVVLDIDRVRLRCPIVKQPRFVRYAWRPFPAPPVNLYNRAGLPASPFSHDLANANRTPSGAAPRTPPASGE